ncbi:hypothetical protein GUITHDRAFT_105068 [Guillardia theta CCMP2712]|uniref:S1 motif domain-containing protein n=1 Tax=Guillardia theta (strain CCMP2712) TaxID=905079 RepID=L1JLJ2_GUITC|nr:hypothetical protein GUITHDRAFT_105068 [Guillardia theta CCMP2712]EKX48985.1 hypothetical protein GUITHDRAFT_105068 [Guillardia theta CCMP2712]|eukprot:XP_005835965.1 hypothetical protein GUITHDRAFT_105068 [Guillardia theta CCMP2712]
MAESIVAHREQEGAFASRADLLQVKGVGKKTFEQAAGFLRVYRSSEMLDSTSVHPESYRAAKGVIKHLGVDLAGATKRKGKKAEEKEKEGREEGEEVNIPELDAKSLSELAGKFEVGEQTLKDILEFLRFPGQDPRIKLLGIPPPTFITASGKGSEKKAGSRKISDVKVGEEVEGIVRNVVAFGAFVDIGFPRGMVLHVGQVIRVAIDSIDEHHKSGNPRLTLKLV